MRKVFLENLPKAITKYDWFNSKNYKIRFEYDNIKGELEIIDYNKKTNKVTVKYMEELFDIKSNSILNGEIGRIVNNIIVAKPHLIKFFSGGKEEAKLYTYGSNHKVYPVCPDCSRVKDKLVAINTINRDNYISCDCNNIGISYPERFMISILKQLNIDFKTEYCPTWIKPKRYDFYIPLLNLIIEMDGALGHGEKIYSKLSTTREDSLEIDNYKDTMAKEHGLEVIRIDCKYDKTETRFDYIKNNTKDKLANILDLNNINWIECGSFASTNIKKEICKYFNENSQVTSGDLAIIFKINFNTITRFLKEGTNLGWCDYDAKKEKSKASRKLDKNGKEVIIIRDKKSLGVFNSCCDLERQSMGKFGLKLISSGISSVCTGKWDSYKGFHFKYTKDLTPQERILYKLDTESQST